MRQQGQRRIAVGRRHAVAAPGLQQFLERRPDRRFVVDDEHGQAFQVDRGGRLHRSGDEPGGRRARHRQSKDRSAPGSGFDLDPMPEQLCRAAHDGQAQPQALGAVALRIVELDELFEDVAQPARLDADAGIAHFEHHRVLASPRRHQHAAAPGISQRVADQVVEHAREHDFVAAHPRVRCAHAQRQRARLRGGREVPLDARQEGVDGQGLQACLFDAGVQPRDVEDGLEQRFHGLGGLVDALDDVVQALAAGALGQQADQQGHRVQRLAQVMAGRGEEARLHRIGLFERACLGGQRRHQAGVLVAEFDHAHEAAMKGPAIADQRPHQDREAGCDAPVDRAPARGVDRGQRAQAGDLEAEQHGGVVRVEDAAGGADHAQREDDEGFVGEVVGAHEQDATGPSESERDAQTDVRPEKAGVAGAREQAREQELAEQHRAHQDGPRQQSGMRRMRELGGRDHRHGTQRAENVGQRPLRQQPPRLGRDG